MKRLQHVRYCLRNGEIERQLTAEYERLRECVLNLEAANQDSSKALRWFAFYGRKVRQAGRVRAKLIARQAA